MDGYWTLETHGDPLGRVRNLIKVAWLRYDLPGVLVTTDEGEGTHAIPRYITNVNAIDTFNPFRPVMEINAARLIPGLLVDYPGAKIGAILRPCELRALVEMSKHTSIDLSRLLTVCVDCLGTLPVDEYQWRRERMQKGLPTSETPDNLAQEALKFARQGGIIPYRYRPACQVCASPAAANAEINIHILGLPVRQKIIISVPDTKVSGTIGMDSYANGKADPEDVMEYERILALMRERHARHMQQINASIANLLPTEVDSLITKLEACGECQACMQACPICSVDQPRRDETGHYDHQSVVRWLVSCAGCGMCEQACPEHLPTAAIFAHIRQQLDEQWKYIPGRSVDESLPIM